MRVPDQKRIYGVNIKAEPSTRFADWIETNLLKVEASKIRRIFFDNYKIQENPNRPGSLVLQRGEKLVITRKDSAGPVDDGWALGERAAQREQPAYAFRCGRRLEDRGNSPPAGGLERP